MQKHNHIVLNLLLFFFFLSSFNAGTGENSGNMLAGENPFTAKASLIRYWNKQITNNLPKPSFLLSKASPLTALDSATLLKLVQQNSLSSHLQKFCSSANLFCFTYSSSSLEKHDSDANFARYSNINFTNYGTSRLSGLDSFMNYSDGLNLPTDTFRRYSRQSTGHDDKFANYAPDGNVDGGSFNTYGTGATDGSGEFKNYDFDVNVPNLRFTSYESESHGRKQSFSSYAEETNSGKEAFVNYGKSGNGIQTEFTSYAKASNVIGSSFNSYNELGNGANDSFSSYAFDTNNPHNNFQSYSEGGNSATESFSSYRDRGNVGDDSFQSYAKDSNTAKVNFLNYGQTFNEGTDTFKGYGKGTSVDQTIGFKTYGKNTTFKDYNPNVVDVSFSKYSNSSPEKNMDSQAPARTRWVEPGKFFRELALTPGNVMPMPDIRDKLPKRSFLPRSISSKLPFSTARVSELNQIFHATNSSMESVLENTVGECERAPSRGETKRCVSSVEDMIDFVVSVLGHNVVVRSTENTNGSKENVMIGRVKRINGGRVTESVSCHQSLFPYMVYYCHSVPKVRVYEADILDVKSKENINRGVAICHLDTKAWGPGHGAFVALGSSPGQIEVCHWIFENDMTWSTAD